MSQDKFAQRTELSAEWIRRFEQGRLPQTELHIAFMQKAAAGCGYDLAGFLREAGLTDVSAGDLAGDPGLRQLVSDISRLDPQSRELVGQLVKLVSARSDRESTTHPLEAGGL
jgi:transcriptional regulator with XRE-family HTH domain